MQLLYQGTPGNAFLEDYGMSQGIKIIFLSAHCLPHKEAAVTQNGIALLIT